MKKSKAFKKDLKNKFSGTIQDVVVKEDPSPSKKVKKLIKRASKKLAAAVANDTRKAIKKAEKAERKAVKGAKPKKEKREKPIELVV
ncbi:hypothetical protein QQ054_25530 [Oscillatoria amoena NRMC-F 0135]|nr:hypothetical protein [Oscillatoria amoena NRMC-F 0135]